MGNCKKSFSITEDMWIASEEQMPEGAFGYSLGQESMVMAEDGLPKTGFLRLEGVLRVIPVSKSTWYDGMKRGIFPQPSKKLGPRIAAWHVDDIRALTSKDS